MPPLVDCPHCRRQTSSDFQPCIHCGQPLPEELLTRAQPGRGTPVTCPLCTSPSEFASLWGIQVDLCTGCRGIWFDESEVADLAAKVPDETLAKDSDAVLAKLDAPPMPSRRAAYLRCPICAKQLVPRNYDRNSQLSVLRCQGCGTFIEREQMLDLLWFLAAHRSNTAGEMAMDHKPVENTYRPPREDPQVAHYYRMHVNLDHLFDSSRSPGHERLCFRDPLRPPIQSGTDAAFAALSLLTDLLSSSK
jgi:hypothetical protein